MVNFIFCSFFRYGKKRSSERYLKFDPCPSSTEMNSDTFLRGIQSLHGSCMWENLIFFTYEDYDLDDKRKAVLHQQVKMFEDGLGNDIERYSADPLSNDDGVHVSGSEEQSDSVEWKEARRFRVTASRFKEFTGSGKGLSEKFWQEGGDLSFLAAVKWGTDHEPIARQEYEEATDTVVEHCGLFISRSNPIFGASPDGLIDMRQGVLEIKCPYSLRDQDLALLDPAKMPSFFELSDDSAFKLRKGHQYFFQIQLAMFVTGCQYCDFVV
jgi:hypothetical protein